MKNVSTLAIAAACVLLVAAVASGAMAKRAADRVAAAENDARYYREIADNERAARETLEQTVAAQSAAYAQDSIRWQAQADALAREARVARRASEQIERAVEESPDSVVPVAVFEEYVELRQVEVDALEARVETLEEERASLWTQRATLQELHERTTAELSATYSQVAALERANAALHGQLRWTRGGAVAAAGLAVAAILLVR